MRHGFRPYNLGFATFATLLFCGYSSLSLSLPARAQHTALATRSEAPGGDLQGALDALVAAHAGPVGVIVTVDDGTSTTVWTAGEAARGTHVPPSPRDHMRIASLTKAFTAAVALSLVQDGRIALTDPIGMWLPELPSAWQAITLEQLLQHTSGVPDFGQNPGFARAVSQAPGAALSPREILALAGHDVEFAPGTRYAYSNSNPFVTGLLIEAITGQGYAAALKERVLDPLHLDGTYLPERDDPAVAAPVFRGYASETGEDVTDGVSFGGWAWASGGLVSTSEDVGKFVRSYVGGALLGERARDAQPAHLIPGSSEPQGPGVNSVGLGVFRYETPCGIVYGHTGSILGYTQFMASSADGSRSVTLAISTQYTAELLPQLRAAESLAVCIALGTP